MSTEKVVEDILGIIKDHELRICALEGGPTKVQNKEKKMSIKEFILLKKPKGYIQIALAIGYYLEHYEEMDSFNVSDLTEGFEIAKEPRPQNINDTVNLNIRQGNMMAAIEKKDNLKAWILTNTGERFVESGFVIESK